MPQDFLKEVLDSTFTSQAKIASCDLSHSSGLSLAIIAKSSLNSMSIVSSFFQEVAKSLEKLI